MRKSILVALVVPMFLAVTSSAQLCAQEPFTESFGFSSEDFGGGAYLGVDTRDITPDRLSELKLKEELGVEVTLVDQDAPAGKAGLKEHDVILNLNGSQVESVEQLRRMIREIPPGRLVSLGISRDGQAMTLKAQLADRKKSFGMGMSNSKAFSFAMPAMPAIPAVPAIPSMSEMDVPVSIVVVHSSARSGLMVENLTPQLGDYFGARDGQGVLVRSVEKGSRADKAGFRAGDVIVKVNGESISDSGDFTHAMHGRKNSTVSVSIIREKKEQTLTLALPERNQSELLDESFEAPEVDAETVIDLSEPGDAESAVARIMPEMEQTLIEVKPDIEEATRAIRNHQQELKKEMRELQRELRDEEIQMQKNHIQKKKARVLWQPEADI
jgi:serine protease Do